MLVFTVQALRTILVAIAVTVGITRQPLFIARTKQLLSASGRLSHFGDYDYFGEDADLNQQLDLPSTELSLSLEWSLFNPANELSKSKSLPSHPDPSATADSDLQQLQINDTLLINYTGNRYVCEDPVGTNNTTIPQQQSVAQPVTISSSLIIDDTLSKHLDFELPLISCLNEDLIITTKDASLIFGDLSDSTGLTISPSSKLDVRETDKSNFSFSPVHDLGEGYLPTSQSACGVLCYHELLRSYIRNTVLSSLPETWAKWITNNRPTLGIICVTVMYGSLLWPILFVLWRKTKSERRLIGELSISNRSCQSLESRVMELTKGNNVLSEQLHREYTVFKNTTISHAEELFQINREMALTEAKLSSATDSFLAAQNQITQHQCHVMRLQEDVQDQCEKIMMLSSENSNLVTRVYDLTKEREMLEMENKLVKCAEQSTMKSWTALEAEHQQAKKELTAAKEACVEMESQLSSMTKQLDLKTEENETLKMENELIKRAKQKTINGWTALQAKHLQTKKELTAAEEACVEMESQLSSMAKQLDVKDIKISEQERELERLCHCQHHLTSEVDELVYKEEGDNEMNVQLTDTSERLLVKIALQECEDVSEQINQELERIQTALRENAVLLAQSLSCPVLNTAENRNTCEQACSFQSVSMTSAENYFEDDLQRELSVMKRKLERCEVLEYEAQEKRIIAEEEIAEERKEWKELRKLLHAVIKSQCKQVQLYKVRAKDAMTHSKLTEKKLQLAKERISDIKRRLIGTVQRPPSTLSQYTPRCPSPLLQANKSESEIQSKGAIRQRVPRLAPERILPALGIACSAVSQTGRSSSADSNVTPLYNLDDKETLSRKTLTLFPSQQ